MELDYRISLWNYFHYNQPGTLERVVGSIREGGYGVEIWPMWSGEENLFDPIYRDRLKLLIRDMPSSIHSGGPDTLEHHRLQIDTAADTESDVIVVHAGHMKLGSESPDYGFAQSVLDIAHERGITLALENGPLEMLSGALENLEGLKICLDVGHVYFTPDPMKAFVDALKQDIRHLHIQDTLGKTDHYTPGTGTIPVEDWTYFFEGLEESGFDGAAVLEIRPREPLQHAEDTGVFLGGLLSAMEASSR
jgi:sugar phosphate isomerase/epimerase